MSWSRRRPRSTGSTPSSRSIATGSRSSISGVTPTGIACSWSRPSSRAGLRRRAGHAAGPAARAEAGLPQRLLDATPGQAVARRGGARRDRHGTADRRRVASEFAVAFYQALTTVSGEDRTIAGGLQPGQGVRRPQGSPRRRTGASPRPHRRDSGPRGHHRRRGIPLEGPVSSRGRARRRWNLFEDDPLFGLPELPEDIGWPDEPYPRTRIVRPRGRPHLLRPRPGHPGAVQPGPRPRDRPGPRLIFYYGQTGVGKTSVLAAGLLPAAGGAFATRYCRRSGRAGLLGTLRAALAPGAEPFDLGAAWLRPGSERPTADSWWSSSTRPRRRTIHPSRPAGEDSTPSRPGRPEDEVRTLFEAVRELRPDPSRTAPAG